MDVKRIEEIFQENPSLEIFAKKNNRKRFINLGFIVFSQPESHPAVTIYGLFVLDKDNIKKNLEKNFSLCEIAQDFIAYDRQSKEFTYYSGQPPKNDSGHHQHINNFCRKFGKWPNGEWGQYECSRNRKTPLHRMENENDQKLPTEGWVRSLLKKKIEEVREELRAAYRDGSQE